MQKNIYTEARECDEHGIRYKVGQVVRHSSRKNTIMANFKMNSVIIKYLSMILTLNGINLEF